MLSAITTALTTVISWVGTVVSAMTTDQGQLSELLPLFAIGISISAFLFAIKGIKSLVWGS